MTKMGDILDAVNEKLVKGFPERTVYVNFCPDNFIRPCFLIEFTSSKQSAASYYINEVSVFITITCFEETDEYSVSSQEELIRIQGEVLSLFGDGVLAVGDRFLDIDTGAGGCDANCSFVDLQLKFFDDRSKTKENEVIMENLNLSVN